MQIQAARKRRGLTQAELARRLERTVSWVADVERGKTTPDAETSVAIAQLLSLDPVELVLEGMGASRLDWLEYVDDDAMRAVAESLVEKFAPPEVDEVEPRSYREIEGIAERLVDKVFWSHAELGQAIPVTRFFDLHPSVDQRRLKLSVMDQLEDGCAMHTQADDAFVVALRPEVWDRARFGEGRDRFTVAHELGHIFLHGDRLLKPGARFFRDSNCSAPQRMPPGVPVYRSPEWQASVFASCMLMPTRSARAYFKVAATLEEHPSILDIAKHFRLSRQAAALRVEKLLPRLAAGGEEATKVF